MIINIKDRQNRNIKQEIINLKVMEMDIKVIKEHKIMRV